MARGGGTPRRGMYWQGWIGRGLVCPGLPGPAAMMGRPACFGGPPLCVCDTHMVQTVTCAPSSLTPHLPPLHGLCLPSCRLPLCPLGLGGHRCSVCTCASCALRKGLLRHKGCAHRTAPFPHHPLQVELKVNSRDALFAMTTLAGVVRESWTRNKGKCSGGGAAAGHKGSLAPGPQRTCSSRPTLTPSGCC